MYLPLKLVKLVYCTCYCKRTKVFVHPCPAVFTTGLFSSWFIYSLMIKNDHSWQNDELKCWCRNSKMFDIIVNLRTIGASYETYLEKLYNLSSKRPSLPYNETSWWMGFKIFQLFLHPFWRTMLGFQLFIIFLLLLKVVFRFPC